MVTWSVDSKETKPFFESITEWLKELMDKIKWWMNSLLESLWLKKKEELDWITKKTEKELDDLKKEINIDLEISTKENAIIDILIIDNEDIKKYFDWLWKDFKENDNIINKEKENILEKINKDTWKITKEELEEFIKNEKKAIEKVKWDKKLKDLVKEINWDYTINEVVSIYEDIKESWNEDITKQDIIDKITLTDEE